MKQVATDQSEIRQALALHKNAFRSVGAFSAVINILMLVPAIYMLQVYDRVLASGNQFTLLMLTGLALGLYGLMGALEWVRSLLVIRIGDQLDEALNQRVYDASFEHQLSGAQSGTFQAAQDLSQVRQFMTGSALFAFFDAPWFPVYLLVLFLFHPWLGALALAGAVILLVLALINERWSKRPLEASSQWASKSNQMATAQLRNADVIEAMGLLSRLRQRWLLLHRQSLAQQCLASERSALINAMTKTSRTALQSLMLGLGAYLAVQGEISAGMMVAGSILVGRMLAPVEQLIGAWRQWTNVQIARDRLNTLLTAYPVKPVGLPLAKPEGHLLLESLSVVAPGAKQPCLMNLTFSLEAGETLAVVGASGSGKSSLAKALVGVWKPRLGKVRLDGADLQNWDKESLGPHIGYLPQDVALFAGSITDNIARFGAVDPEQVFAAARQAGVHELILSLPKGYDTELADGGMGLSGGQKQRIGLARALYGQPALMVLDEPNANLDEHGEKALAEAIKQMKEAGQTVVLITHKLGVLALTDKVLALKSGSLQTFGPTSTVLAALNGQTPLKKPAPDTQSFARSPEVSANGVNSRVSYSFGSSQSGAAV
ncbi:type I secretion system permease/ATPase [Litoribacillus peritrichatus]|uniref:Type I secretion system permease/ATPase n=1 Tax=Litoribacillus peritrichatus TaxID=718191 RepID=A0ABP7N9T0_9GAMM